MPFKITEQLHKHWLILSRTIPYKESSFGLIPSSSSIILDIEECSHRITELERISDAIWICHLGRDSCSASSIQTKSINYLYIILFGMLAAFDALCQRCQRPQGARTRDHEHCSPIPYSGLIASTWLLLRLPGAHNSTSAQYVCTNTGVS